MMLKQNMLSTQKYQKLKLQISSSTISEEANNSKNKIDTFGEIADSSIRDYIDTTFDPITDINDEIKKILLKNVETFIHSKRI